MVLNSRRTTRKSPESCRTPPYSQLRLALRLQNWRRLPRSAVAYDLAGLFARASELLTERPEMSAQSLAKQIGVHRHTLAAVILSQAGCSFIAWRRQRRLAEARKLLQERPSLSTKEVAARVGLSLAGLDHLFKKALGVTPTELRSKQPREP